MCLKQNRIYYTKLDKDILRLSLTFSSIVFSRIREDKSDSQEMKEEVLKIYRRDKEDILF